MHIKIIITDKIARADKHEPLVCGNSDYIIDFTFDAEWNDYHTKTARFIFDDRSYTDVVFTGTQCRVPVLKNTHDVIVGVFAGDLKTTTPAYLHAQRSILCGGGAPADPDPDVYNQIMELLNKGGGGASVTPEAIEEAVEDYLTKNPIEFDESDPSVPDWAKQPEKPSYTAQEVGALPADTEIPEAYTLPVATADTLGGVKVGEGLQMDGDVLGIVTEGKYQLLESITIDAENTGLLEIVRNNYGSIAAAVVIIRTPKTEASQYMYVTAGNGKTGITCGGASYFKEESGRNKYLFRCINGVWDAEAQLGRSSMSGTKTGQTNNHLLYTKKEIEEITTIRIYTFSPGLHQGTIIDIWGVRANA